MPTAFEDFLVCYRQPHTLSKLILKLHKVTYIDIMLFNKRLAEMVGLRMQELEDGCGSESCSVIEELLEEVPRVLHNEFLELADCLSAYLYTVRE